MLRKVVLLSIIATASLANNDLKLDSVVVSVSGFESTLRDEVKNIHIITKDDISNRGYINLSDVLKSMPSINFSDPGFGETIDLRGQGNKANTSVKVLLNGTSLNMIDTSHAIVPIDMIDIDDVERIEVIAGGGSVLYGSGTSGGVINIITKAKPRDFYAKVSSKIGSYNYKDFGFGIGGVVRENLFLKFNTKIFDQNGYRKGDKNKGSYASFGGVLDISENQKLSFDTSLHNSKIKTTDKISSAKLAEDRRAGGGFLEPLKHSKFDLNFDYLVNINENLKLNFTPKYQNIKMLNADKSGGFTDQKAGANLKSRYVRDNLEFVFGYDYTYNKGTRERVMNIRGVNNYTFLNLKKYTHSGYVLNKYSFTDSLSISAGYRLEKALYDLSRYSNTKISMPATPPRPAVNMQEILFVKDKKDESNYAFEIAPSFKYSNTGNVYFKFERGYISPSPTQLTDKVARAGAQQAYYKINDLKSETFLSYEFGLKDSYLGNFFSMSAFLTDTNNEIVNETIGGHGSAWKFYNLDQTRRMGFELVGEQTFNKFKLNQSISYVDAKIKKGKNAGKGVPLVSKTKIVLGAEYELLKELSMFVNAIYHSGYFDSRYAKQPSRTLVDIGAFYEIKDGFFINLGVKNLFNKKYNSYANAKNDAFIPANERNFYIEFKYAY